MYGDKQTQVVTVQSGSTTFHVIMTIFTAGLWLPVWFIFFRRKQRVTVRYR